MRDGQAAPVPYDPDLFDYADPAVRVPDRLGFAGFRAHAAINQPGQFPIRGEMTVRNVIARSGGIAPSGSLKRIKLFRDGEEQKVDMDMKIQAGDVFTIGERAF